MRIIGVVDLLGGRAVHAVAGARDRYQPVQPLDGALMSTGDAEGLSRHYIDRLGVDTIYVADLDAIQAGSPPHTLIERVSRLGAPVYADAGISTLDGARSLLSLGVSRVVIGLETLPSSDALNAICAGFDDDVVVLSLDLRDGKPLSTGTLVHDAAEDIAARAAKAGVREMIVLDLARVGMGTGLDLDLIARVRAATPRDVVLLAGGGVRGFDDLQRLADAGCDGALVATALQNGTLTASDVAAARLLKHRPTPTPKT